MYDETYAPVHCNWCGWSGDEADLDMNEHDEPTYCPVCGRSDCIAEFDFRKNSQNCFHKRQRQIDESFF